VTSKLLEEALEHYWRSIAMIKPNEEVKINIDLNGTLEAEVKTTKEVVEVFRL
jgi:hypothetical protein